MSSRKKIFAINGSASRGSSNQKLIDRVGDLVKDDFQLTVYNELKDLPHFDPQLSDSDPPAAVKDFRKLVEEADGILICTPEYIFSIPSGLKNAIEWCVSTVVFSDKPTGIITASASGQKAHEELKLIMRTVQTKFTEETTLLVQGIKGKINERGEIVHDETKRELAKFVEAFKALVAQ